MVHPVRTGPSTISSLNQFGGSGVVIFSAGGVGYQLNYAPTGSALQDIMVGGATADRLSSLDGADFVYGTGGRDSIDLGNDFGFGGNGVDLVRGDNGEKQRRPPEDFVIKSIWLSVRAFPAQRQIIWSAAKAC